MGLPERWNAIFTLEHSVEHGKLSKRSSRTAPQPLHVVPIVAVVPTEQAGTMIATFLQSG